MFSKIDPKLNDAINIASNWLDYISYSRRIPSVSLGIIFGTRLVYSENFGFSDVEKRKKSSCDTAYRIASISKTFTAVAIFQLAEKRLLSLDDPVVKHLEWFKSDSDNNLEHITIRQILCHASGLARETDCNCFLDDKFPDAEHIKKYISKNPTIFSPYEIWKYSNLGYCILGLLIEQVSGKSYEEYITEHIIRKLNMSRTWPNFSEKLKSYLAKGYSNDVPNKKRKPFCKGRIFFNIRMTNK